MILHSYRHQGTISFPTEVAVDFDQLPALIGIHGKNGAGKTTFLDTLVAAFYLQMPFRPEPLHAVFATRGFIDVVWSLSPRGPMYRSRVNVDPTAERTEAVLYPAEGGSALAGPLQRAYLAKIKELLGPLDLFLCTSYTTQPSYTTGKNAFSFLLADRSERRAIMGEMLGLGQYAMRHAASRDKIRGVDTKLNGLRTAQGQWEADLTKRPEAQKRADDLAARLLGAQEGLTAAQKALETAQETLRAVKTAKDGYGPYRTQQDVLAAELTGLRRRLKETETGIEKARAGVAAAEEHAAAPALKDSLQAQLAELRPAELQLGAVEREIRETEIEIQDAVEEVQTHQAVLDRADAIETAAARDRELEGQLARLDREIDSSATADEVATKGYNEWVLSREGLRQKQREVKSLEQAVSLIDQVPCKGEERFAGCQFLVNAAQAREDLPAVASAVAVLEEAVGADRLPPVSATPALKLQRDSFRDARTALAELLDLRSKLDIARTRVDGLHDQIDTLNRRLTDKQSLRSELVAKAELIKPLQKQLTHLEPLVVLARSLDAHKATAAGFDSELQRLQGDINAKVAQLAEVQSHLVGAEGVDARLTESDIAVTRAAGDVRTATAAWAALNRESAAAVTRLQALDEVARRMAKTQEEIQSWGTDLDDWSLIARSQSPSGIPALLIDQALPEISALATDMLQECLGESLFSITLTTQRASATDDKKLLEVLDVLVFRDGKKLAVEHLSGGEGVLVSEALSIAIDLYNARIPGGKRRYTLFRDEVGANLDVVRAPAYARLLARALKMGDYDKAIFVSHHVDALKIADARLGIADGRISIT